MLRSSARKPQAQAARRAPLRQSAGLLCYRTHRANRALGAPEIFPVHPGGPFWRNKDAHAWSIPKGELEENEAPLDGARRELIEETGLDARDIQWRSGFTPLPPLKASSGKILLAFAVEADFDASVVRSNLFALEWPPHSGKMREFPEIDRAAWFGLDLAVTKLHASQAALTGALRDLLRLEASAE